MTETLSIGREAIRAAALRIAPHIRRTPLLRLAGADLGLPHDVILKLELLQASGSFKPRGAFNTLLSGPVPAAGVVAASGGMICLPKRKRALAASSIRARLRKRIGAPLTTIMSPWRSSSTSVDILFLSFAAMSWGVAPSLAAAA